jgi:hypothetical protein
METYTDGIEAFVALLFWLMIFMFIGKNTKDY